MAAAAAQQAQAQTPARALTTPPHRTPTHSHTQAQTSTSGSGSCATGALANSDPASVDAPKHSGLTTPIQTPAQVARPPPPRAPPPRAVATSPLARMRSAPERNVSFTEPMPVRAGSVDTADQNMGDTVQGSGDGRRRNDKDDDEDAFPLSTQDDAFLATVDLGEGDLGRPIDFEEGMGGAASVSEPELDSARQLPAVPPRPQVRDHAESGTSAWSSSGGAPKTNMRNEVQGQPAAKRPPLTSDPNASTSGGQPRPQPRSGPLNTVSTSMSTRAEPLAQDIKRPRPSMTSMGGFHFPPGMVRLFFSFSPSVVIPRSLQHPAYMRDLSPLFYFTLSHFLLFIGFPFFWRAETAIATAAPTTRPKTCGTTIRPDDDEYASDGTDERAQAQCRGDAVRVFFCVGVSSCLPSVVVIVSG